MSPKATTGFYVGSKDIASGRSTWGHDQTYEQALARARGLCEETGEPQIVVEIVARVERAVVPIKVTVTRPRRGRRT